MAKRRQAIPRDVRERVLKEFNHRCAIGGEDNPQIHHIDGDPSNNDPPNLIPLCPNCHLTDQHNPTKAIEPERLRLFRKYKDPTILKPQFYPLYVRLQFLRDVPDDCDGENLNKKIREMIEFIDALNMGSFYAKRVTELIEMPTYIGTLVWSDLSSKLEDELRYRDHVRGHIAHLRTVYDQVCDLAVELLHFQPW